MKTRVLVVAVTLVMVGCKNPSNNIEKGQGLPVDTVTVVVDTVAQAIEEEQPIQLIKKHILSEKDLYTDYDGGSQLANFFVIELIDKATFLRNRSSAVEYFTIDSTSIKKNKGVLRLPCTHGTVTLTDNLSDGERHKEFSYMGQVKALNAYLISGIYWEDWNYFFVDKHAGRTIQTFSSLPYLSADERFIVSVDIDSFEGAAYIDLYEVNNKRHIDPMIGMYIKNWIPMGNDKMYWSVDNYLYMAVLSNRDYWAAEGNYAGLDQYIRLRPVA